MATLNLGRIKPVFQGAYNNSTAYVVDDIVTFGDESFICIQASTGNATSNASYWTKLAAKGTNGTDVGTTITTQGDILYRDGSGLQRLGAGTSGQFLKTQGTGANPVWGDVSAGGLEHIATTVVSSATGYVNFNNCFTTDYDMYRFHYSNFYNDSQNNQRLVSYLMDTSGNHLGSGQYETVHNIAYANAGTDGHGSGRDWGVNFLVHINSSIHTGVPCSGWVDIANPRDASNRVTWNGQSMQHDGTYHRVTNYAGCLANNVEIYGMNFTVTGGSIKADSTFSVYGYKKS